MKNLLINFKILSVLISLTALSPQFARATNIDETSGDFSNDRLNPNQFVLSYGQSGSNGNIGNNILSGRTGRVNGVVDRDYLHIIVPTGFVWSELLVGNQTTVGSNSSFIGLAAGSTMPIDPNTAINATGLLGYRLYSAIDLQQNILDDMAMSGNGSSGFNTPLSAGDYTLWIQELAPGNYNYRFNLILTPVPEPSIFAALFVGLVLLANSARRKP